MQGSSGRKNVDGREGVELQRAMNINIRSLDIALSK